MISHPNRAKNSRYVLIDENSGYVWGDAIAADPIGACRTVDEKCGEHNRTYTDIGRGRFDGRSGYHVFRAPEDFVEVGDGQDPEYIKMVEAFPFVTRVVTSAEIA